MNVAIRLSTAVCGPAHDPQCVDAAALPRSLGYFNDFPPGTRVLDVGAGNGEHLAALRARKCQPVGVEIDPTKVANLADRGFNVVRAPAESLPFADRTFDAVICSVVVPYTDERMAIREWSRVLVDGGHVRASFHLVGYPLQQLISGPNLRIRLYGGRTIINSWVYRFSGRRLPGFWGDTLYQSRTRLLKYYRSCSLHIAAEHERTGVSGWPDLLFHHLRKN
jgi:SAM-dependent methyltransferase